MAFEKNNRDYWDKGTVFIDSLIKVILYCGRAKKRINYRLIGASLNFLINLKKPLLFKKIKTRK